MHEDARRVHLVGIDRTGRHDVLVHLRYREACRGRHHRTEIALRAVELQVAERVGAGGSDEGVVERQRVFQQVLAAVDHACLATLCEFGTDGGGRVERRDAGAGRAQTFGKRALRHQFRIDLAELVVLGERQRIGGTCGGGEGADHFPHLAVLHQHADVGHAWLLRPAGCVGNEGELLRAVFEQCLDQVERHARHREAAECDDAAVADVLHRLAEAGDLLGFLRHLPPLFVVVRR